MTRTPTEAAACAVARAEREMRAALAAIAHCETFPGLELATRAYAAASRRLEQAREAVQ